MKHFVTLFPPARNVHLIKDVGQIPYQMHRQFGHRSTLVCYQNDPEYFYLDREVKGLNITFLEDRGSALFWEKSALQYIFKKSRSIEVLNLYHLTQASMLYGIVYKMLNPSGILYLKLDFNLNSYLNEGFKFSENSWKNRFHHLLLKWFLAVADIISVETRKAKQMLENEWSKLNEHLLYLPNGVAESPGNNLGSLSADTAKENIILTVGRIGSPEKNHELLLEALSETSLKGWKCLFVGAVDDSFQDKIDRFREQNPAKSDQVRFVGAVDDRDDLYEFYKRSKIFCLPSKSEGFPLALVEALQFGNYIIGTETITSIREVTNGGEFGHIVSPDNVHELSKALEKAMRDDFYTDAVKKDIMQFAQQYRWPTILKGLNSRLNKIWRAG